MTKELLDKAVSMLTEMRDIVNRIAALNHSIPDEWPPVINNGFTGV